MKYKFIHGTERKRVSVSTIRYFLLLENSKIPAGKSRSNRMQADEGCRLSTKVYLEPIIQLIFRFLPRVLHTLQPVNFSTGIIRRFFARLHRVESSDQPVVIASFGFILCTGEMCFRFMLGDEACGRNRKCEPKSR